MNQSQPVLLQDSELIATYCIQSTKPYYNVNIHIEVSRICLCRSASDTVLNDTLQMC